MGGRRQVSRVQDASKEITGCGALSGHPSSAVCMSHVAGRTTEGLITVTGREAARPGVLCLHSDSTCLAVMGRKQQYVQWQVSVCDRHHHARHQSISSVGQLVLMHVTHHTQRRHRKGRGRTCLCAWAYLAGARDRVFAAALDHSVGEDWRPQGTLLCCMLVLQQAERRTGCKPCMPTLRARHMCALHKFWQDAHISCCRVAGWLL